METNYKHNFLVMYGTSKLKEKDYILWDQAQTRVVFMSNSKSEVIAEAQRRNGFKPVDGDEQTYGKQTKVGAHA